MESFTKFIRQPVDRGRVMDRGVVNWSGGVIGGGGVGVDGGALVGHLGDVASVVVSGVAHCLNTAVREGHRVRALG